MKILFLGDSLTYGYGVPRRKNWVSLTAAMTGVEAVNGGISGDTSGGMLARLQPLLLEHRPDFVFILGGLNDLVIGVDPKTICSNLFAISFQSAYRGAVPVLAIPPLSPSCEQTRHGAVFARGGLKRRYFEYASWLRKFAAAEELRLIDLEHIFDDENGAADESYYCDGRHPSEIGHTMIAAAMSDMIHQLQRKGG